MDNSVILQEIGNRLACWMMLQLAFGVLRRRTNAVLNSATNQLRKRNDREQHGSPKRGR
jgi:hypothetical protein